MNKHIHKTIETIASQYIDLKLECDGMTRVLSYLLRQNGIEHSYCMGYISRIDKEGFGMIIPHFWIELPDGATVDYRARMWLGNEDCIPNGVFFQGDYEAVKYDVRFVKQLEVSRSVFRLLTEKWVDLEVEFFEKLNSEKSN